MAVINKRSQYYRWELLSGYRFVRRILRHGIFCQSDHHRRALRYARSRCFPVMDTMLFASGLYILNSNVFLVIPAKAGIQGLARQLWIPACAGMTNMECKYFKNNLILTLILWRQKLIITCF